MHGAHAGSPLRRGWLRLLDGEHAWGSLDIQPGRFGVTSYRMVVFPPGISVSERRRVRVARGWPLWGALVWLICEIWLRSLTGPLPALALSTGAYVATGVVATAMAAEQRSRVRTMTATVSATFRVPAAEAARDTLARLALTLTDADDQLERGRISVAEHELTWWRVYDQMRPTPDESPFPTGSADS